MPPLKPKLNEAETNYQKKKKKELEQISRIKIPNPH